MKPRRVALWDISESCNLNCRFCYHLVHGETWSHEKVDAEAAFQTLQRLAAEGVTEIFFVGGEPLLNKALPTIIDRARSLEIDAVVTTNGAFGNPELFRNVVSRVQLLEVSIDSLKQTYLDSIRRTVLVEQLLQFLQWALGVAPRVRVLMTVTRRNLDEVRPLALRCRELGIDDFKIQPVYIPPDVGWRDELVLSVEQHDELERIARELFVWSQGLEDYFTNIGDCAREGKKWTACSAFKNYIYIDVQGHIRRCPALREDLPPGPLFQQTARVCEEMSLDCLSCFNIIEDFSFKLAHSLLRVE